MPNTGPPHCHSLCVPCSHLKPLLYLFPLPRTFFPWTSSWLTFLLPSIFTQISPSQWHPILTVKTHVPSYPPLAVLISLSLLSSFFFMLLRNLLPHCGYTLVMVSPLVCELHEGRILTTKTILLPLFTQLFAFLTMTSRPRIFHSLISGSLCSVMASPLIPPMLSSLLVPLWLHSLMFSPNIDQQF